MNNKEKFNCYSRYGVFKRTTVNFFYVFQNGVSVVVKITVINSFKMSSDKLESWKRSDDENERETEGRIGERQRVSAIN